MASTDDSFLADRAGIPSHSPQLFRHERFLEQTLAERIFHHGQLVAVSCEAPLVAVEGTTHLVTHLATQLPMKLGHYLPARVLTTVEGLEALVEFAADVKSTEFVKLERLNLLAGGVEGKDEEVLSILANRRDLLGRRLVDFIELGQAFELHSTSNPLDVSVVRIEGHHSGLVTVRAVGIQEGEGDSTETVHITSTRCHPLGWTLRQSPSMGYRLHGFTASNHSPPPVPSCLFNFDPLRENSFERGMLLEVLDPSNRMQLRPAFVCRIVNPHLFCVRAILHLSQENSPFSDEILCWAGSEWIYPLGFAAKNSLRLTLPKGMGQADSSFSYAHLRKAMREVLMGREGGGEVSFAPEALFNGPAKEVNNREDLYPPPPFKASSPPPHQHQRAERMRFLKLQHPHNPLAFLPAAIIRSTRELVWIHNEEDGGGCSPPRIYSTRSLSLFRWDFPSKANLPTIFPSASPLPSIRWFDLSTTFTSQRTTIFRENKKKFLSAMWMDGDLWLPNVYLNLRCFAGPFLNPTKLSSVYSKPCYGPGPLPHRMQSIVRDLLACANRQSQMIELLQAEKESRLPKMVVKLKQVHKRTKVTVEICEKSKEFPGWLRMLLIRLDACPNLIALDRRRDNSSQCSLNCDDLASIEWMQPEGHINTAPPSTSTNLPRLPATTQTRGKKQQQPKRPASALGGGGAGAVSGQSPNKRHHQQQRRRSSPSPSPSSYDSSEDSPPMKRLNEQEQEENSASSSADSFTATPAPTPAPAPSQSLPGLISSPPITTNPKRWSREELAEWVSAAGLPDIGRRLYEEEVDGESVMLFTGETCRRLGLKLGPAVKLESLVKKLKEAALQRS